MLERCAELMAAETMKIGVTVDVFVPKMPSAHAACCVRSGTRPLAQGGSENRARKEQVVDIAPLHAWLMTFTDPSGIVTCGYIIITCWDRLISYKS